MVLEWRWENRKLVERNGGEGEEKRERESKVYIRGRR